MYRCGFSSPAPRSRSGVTVEGSSSTIRRSRAGTCRCQAAGVQVRVTDLGSTNGTLVDGRRIDGEHIVGPGEVVQVGASTIVSGTARAPRRRMTREQHRSTSSRRRRLRPHPTSGHWRADAGTLTIVFSDIEHSTQSARRARRRALGRGARDAQRRDPPTASPDTEEPRSRRKATVSCSAFRAHGRALLCMSRRATSPARGSRVHDPARDARTRRRAHR